ncbi:hypothetical protein CRG98_024468 [Punica granatum]|uniref:Uncharacterized protein n=1 Tax=Punica granatum TaxID=22663 RepID=A0A2I0JFZ0_PUNGR|nr:hypothetical protein CRG98_024468 [Punica granatum]
MTGFPLRSSLVLGNQVMEIPPRTQRPLRRAIRRAHVRFGGEQYYLKAKLHLTRISLLLEVLGEARLLLIGSSLTVPSKNLEISQTLPFCSKMRSIVSKQVGSSERGKAQGCISGISSFGNFNSPLVLSPLTEDTVYPETHDKSGSS